MTGKRISAREQLDQFFDEPRSKPLAAAISIRRENARRVASARMYGSASGNHALSWWWSYSRSRVAAERSTGDRR